MMVNVDKYSSTMEYMGMLFQLFQLKHPMSSHYHKSILTPDLYDYNYHTIYIYISHYISHRIHGAAICGVPWIPSTYPLYVSIYIYIPAPWALGMVKTCAEAMVSLSRLHRTVVPCSLWGRMGLGDVYNL